MLTLMWNYVVGIPAVPVPHRDLPIRAGATDFPGLTHTYLTAKPQSQTMVDGASIDKNRASWVLFLGFIIYLANAQSPGGLERAVGVFAGSLVVAYALVLIGSKLRRDIAGS